jgi:P4 family phage/plasmid primase-like protien
MTEQVSVSALLEATYGISARPGMKVNCPFCQHHTLSIKPDDSLAKCFHSSCGRFVTAHGSAETVTLASVLAGIYHDFHQELLQLKDAKYLSAYQYLVDHRKIHPRVVEDSMLGAIPSGGYALALHFQPLIDVMQAAIADPPKARGRPKKAKGLTPAERLQWLMETQEKLQACLLKHAGWLAFFYTDAHHHIVAIRFRKPEPETKQFVYFKPYKTVSGLFGHGVFAPYETNGQQAYNEHLIVTEGEFNSLQLQSVYVRQMEAQGKPPAGYVYTCSVGGTNNTDWTTIQALVKTPILAYDDDEAGRSWLEHGRQAMRITAFTTPTPSKDLDAYIRSFGGRDVDAWAAVKSLVKDRQPCYRLYSGTGVEFFDGKRFIPKRLGDAIMERHYLKYAAGTLWIYRDGVYRSDGEPVVKREAQTLLGEQHTEGHVQETLRYLEVEATVPAPTIDLNIINVRNGRLAWRTRTLMPHTPEVFDMMQLPLDYDEHATCPRYDKYLETTLDADVVPLVDELFGYCTAPNEDVKFEKSVMLLGEGKNGKGVMLDTLTAMLGPDHVSNVALQDLTEDRFAAAGLLGKLANIFADLDDRALKSTSAFKMLSTGDEVEAQHKFGHRFKFRNYARMIFSANKMPHSRDRTFAFYRRWIIIEFTRTFDGTADNKHLRQQLREELSGIFNRAITGLQRLYACEEFTMPQRVRDALATYQRENDTVTAFAIECLCEDHEPLTNQGLLKQGVYSTYLAWCRQQGIKKPTDAINFWKRLRRLFPSMDDYRESGGRGPRRCRGIKFSDDAPDPLMDKDQDEREPGADDE